MSEQAVLDAESVKNESSFKPVKMPQEVQQKMETAFGYDLSKVKMTESSYADAIGARAYAKGDSINFAPGEFNPLSSKGQELIGHEIGHVVQQSRGEVSSQGKIGEDGVNLSSSLEAKADIAGTQAMHQGGQSASGEMQSLEVSGEGVIQGAWRDNVKTAGTAAGGLGQLSGLAGGAMGLAATIMGDDAPEWLKITGAAASLGGNIGGAAEWGSQHIPGGNAAPATAPAPAPAVAPAPAPAPGPQIGRHRSASVAPAPAAAAAPQIGGHRGRRGSV